MGKEGNQHREDMRQQREKEDCTSLTGCWIRLPLITGWPMDVLRLQA
jgi:hypothetical protein